MSCEEGPAVLALSVVKLEGGETLILLKCESQYSIGMNSFTQKCVSYHTDCTLQLTSSRQGCHRAKK